MVTGWHLAKLYLRIITNITLSSTPTVNCLRSQNTRIQSIPFLQQNVQMYCANAVNWSLAMNLWHPMPVWMKTMRRHWTSIWQFERVRTVLSMVNVSLLSRNSCVRYATRRELQHIHTHSGWHWRYDCALQHTIVDASIYGQTLPDRNTKPPTTAYVRCI